VQIGPAKVVLSRYPFIIPKIHSIVVGQTQVALVKDFVQGWTCYSHNDEGRTRCLPSCDRMGTYTIHR